MELTAKQLDCIAGVAEMVCAGFEDEEGEMTYATIADALTAATIVNDFDEYDCLPHGWAPDEDQRAFLYKLMRWSVQGYREMIEEKVEGFDPLLLWDELEVCASVARSMMYEVKS
jgi:hypothetical protein